MRVGRRSRYAAAAPSGRALWLKMGADRVGLLDQYVYQCHNTRPTGDKRAIKRQYIDLTLLVVCEVLARLLLRLASLVLLCCLCSVATSGNSFRLLHHQTCSKLPLLVNCSCERMGCECVYASHVKKFTVF
jgi:hypothetical protein